ncbi:MAG: hypothetical protein V4592_15180 [Bacteroidota bacterium]
MKRLIILGLVFYCLNGFGQSKPDTTLATYIVRQHYTLLTDTVHLYKSVLPYYASLMDFASGDNAGIRNFYIPVAGVRDEPYLLTIALWDLASIKIQKAYDEDKSNIIYSSGGEGMKVLMTRAKPPLASNPSGHCGDLIINKLSGKATFKLYK